MSSRDVNTTALTALLIEVGRGRLRVQRSGARAISAQVPADTLGSLEQACAAVYAKDLDRLLELQITARPGPDRTVSVA